MKKFLLTATAIAALSAISTSALAVDLNTGAGLVTFASELIVDNTTVLQGPGAPDPSLDVTHLIVPGVAASANKWFKYTLTNGTFGTAVVGTDLVIAGLTSPPDIVKVLGGNVGDNYVIFQVSPPGNTPVAQNATATLNLGSGAGEVKVGLKASPILLTYEMHETLCSAQGTCVLELNDSKTNTFAAFASGYTFAVTPNMTTAEVATEYKTFVDGITTLRAEIGKFTHKATPNVFTPLGAQVLITDLLAVPTRLFVKTEADWSSLGAFGGGVYISGVANDCASAASPGQNQTAVSPFTIDIGLSTNEFTDRTICYQASGTAPIQAQKFEVSMVTGEKPGVPPLDVPYTFAGEFKRNGTFLKHAFARRTIASQGFSHEIHLANNTTTDANFYVLCYREGQPLMNGITNGVVPANKGAVYNIGSGTKGLGCNTDSLRAIELIFDRPNGSVWGAVVRMNASGDYSYDTMIGSQLGSK
jgi:hypothetical protein